MESSVLSIKNDIKKEKRLSVVLVAILLLPTVKFSIVQSIPGLYIYNPQANIFIAILIMFLLFPTIGTLINRSGVSIIINFLLLTSFIIINYMLYPDNIKNIIDHIFDIYFISFVCLTLAISIRDYKLFLNLLHKSSFIMIISGFFMLVSTSVIGVVGIAKTEYNMSLSYYMVIPTVTLLLIYYRRKSIINLIFFGIGLLVIFAMGSRGPLLCILTFFFLYNFKYREKTYKRFLADFGYLILGLIFALNSIKIFQWIYERLLSFNINSRTLYYLINGKITSLSNRDIILNELTEIILDNPITGVGFLGDLRSHNIIIEAFLFYGVFVGSVLLLILLYIIIKSLMYKSNKELSFLILIFFSYAIPDALLNLTVWGKDMFWIYIGFTLISIKRNKRGMLKQLNNSN